MKKSSINGRLPEKEEWSPFDIDPLLLDQEWIAHARRYHDDFALPLATARKDYSTAKAYFELTEARLKKAIRTDPKSFGVSKITDKAVEECVIIQRKYQRAQEAMIEAKYAVDVLEAGKSAMEHRKKALEDAVDLLLAGYWAEPRTRRGTASRDYTERLEKEKVRHGKRRVS